MVVENWALDKLLVYIVGSLFLLLAFVVGGYIAERITSSMDRGLENRGVLVARILSHEIAPELLTDNRVAMQESLLKAQKASAELTYLAVTDETGAVVAHTFRNTIPSELLTVWADGGDSIRRIELNGEPLAEIGTAVLSPEVGYLHVGLSRAELIKVKSDVLQTILLQFLVGGVILFAAVRIIAGKVAKPLRTLERQVSLFPSEDPIPAIQSLGGTREVRAVADGFADMVERLNALEEERLSTQQRMIHAERLAVLGEVAAGLAHEIHNPLDGMQECLRYLQEDSAQNERTQKYYPMLEDGLERIRRTMQEMLNFARSGQDVAVQPVKVEDVLHSLSLLVEQQLQGRHVDISWPSSASCVCLCDKHALSQACLNLILNAAEAAEQNPAPKVRVSVRCDVRWAYLAVEDNGPGVDPDLRQKIFEPFFTTKPTERGTGLGLSVSRELIWASGGQLTLQSGAGTLGGAVFTIKLRKCADSKEC